MSQELPSNLIVNYIPRDFTDDLLNKLFVQFGEIESARIIRDKLTNETKGYGFVKFVSGDSAVKAISALNGFEILGKRLKLSYSHHNKAPIPQAAEKTQQPQQMQAPTSPMLLVLPRPISPAPLQFATAPMSPMSDVEVSHNGTPVSFSAISPRHMPAISPAVSPNYMPLIYSPQLLLSNQLAQMNQMQPLTIDPRYFQFSSLPIVPISALNMM